LKNSALGALLFSVACGIGAMAIAQEKQSGRIVRIAPDDQGATIQVPTPGGEIVRDDRPVAPSHWIGLTGGPVTPELRAHVDLPADQGILVHDIVPNSPAAKAGLRQFDILLRGNEAALRGMEDLVELVVTEGQKEGQISLEVLRKGQRQSLAVKPEKRPEDLESRLPSRGEQGQSGQFPELSDIPAFRQFFRNFGDGQMEFRQFGPGVVVGQGGGLTNMPNGVSVSIQKQNDQPARITVKRGGETWEVVGDDPESLKQLPEDLRPFVEQMLHGNAANRFNFRVPGPEDMPRLERFNEGGLRERMEQLERRVQELLDQQRGNNRPAGEQGK
jgi:membrane-associated protease RseP (regulator of RpoE activity)